MHAGKPGTLDGLEELADLFGGDDDDDDEEEEDEKK